MFDFTSLPSGWVRIFFPYLLSVGLPPFLGFVAKCIYNRYFHPLANFPGPFWASVTDLYLATSIGSVPTSGLELHRKHGRFVRLGPNLLSFSDPRLLPEVYHRHADKPPFYASWLFGETAAMFQTLSHKQHAVKKKVISSCCSMKAMRGFEHKLNDRIEELCEIVRVKSACTGEPIDFTEYIRFFLSDVFNHLSYGEPLGCVAQGRDVDGQIEALQNIYFMAATVAVLPTVLLPLLKQYFLRKYFWAFTKTFKSMEKVFSHYKRATSKRLSSSSLKDSKCFFDGLSNPGHDPIVHFGPDDRLAEHITFTAATLDGVAAFISPFIDNMLQHPDVYKRLVNEIDSADIRGALSFPVVQYDEIISLPYFTACINESLRRDAPAQTILPRVVGGNGLRLPDGVFVPPGTEIGASPYIIHREAEIFGESPEEFRPERWLGDREHVQRMERYGMWWGYGDRECAGKFYALMEIQKLCLELFRRFEIRSRGHRRYKHEKWAVGMYWEQALVFKERKMNGGGKQVDFEKAKPQKRRCESTYASQQK